MVSKQATEGVLHDAITPIGFLEIVRLFLFNTQVSQLRVKVCSKVEIGLRARLGLCD